MMYFESPFWPDMVLTKRPRFTDRSGHSHSFLFWKGVKSFETRILKVSLQSAAFYANYLRKTDRGPSDTPPLQVHGLIPY